MNSARPCLPMEGCLRQLRCRSKSLELVIDFIPRSRFPDPDSDSGELWPVHDTVQRTWQHLNFFEHATTLRARVPRIKTAGGSLKNASFPWV